jgi:hypothetical protein
MLVSFNDLCWENTGTDQGFAHATMSEVAGSAQSAPGAVKKSIVAINGIEVEPLLDNLALLSYQE